MRRSRYWQRRRIKARTGSVYTVGIAEGCIHRGGSMGKVVYRRRVRASGRRDALERCLPEIRRKVLPLADEDIKYVSVFVGKRGSVTASAGRLDPMRIERATGRMRPRIGN